MIFTEGENSEPDYLNGLKRLEKIRKRTSINIEISTRHGTPSYLVRKAIERARDREVDQCWCVFDVEWPLSHSDLPRALDLAKTSPKVGLAVSNPCFEAWLVLHHQDLGGVLTTKQACERRRELDGAASKSVDPELYLPKRDIAADRARRLEQLHEQNGKKFPYGNPSSSMHLLVDALEADLPRGSE